MVKLDDLSEEQEGSGDSFAGLTPEAALELMSETPNADINLTVESLSAAATRYKQHASTRQYIADVLTSFGPIATVAKSFLV